MRNALSLIKKFFVFSAVGIVFLLFAYYLYLLCVSLMVGEAVVFPPLASLWRVLPIACAAAAIIAALLVECALITQSGAFLFSSVLCVLFMLFAWFAVVPACALWYQTRDAGKAEVAQKIPTASYFRSVDGRLLYFVRSSQEENRVWGLSVEKQGSAAAATVLSGDTFVADESSAFRDTLVSDTMVVPPLVALFRHAQLSFWRAARDALLRGSLAWLCFASLCLPLAALSALARTWRWKLLNLCMFILLMSFIFALNQHYYAGAAVFARFAAGAKQLTASSAQADVMAPYTLIVVLNTTLAVLFAAAGVLMNLGGARKKRGR